MQVLPLNSDFVRAHSASEIQKNLRDVSAAFPALCASEPDRKNLPQRGCARIKTNPMGLKKKKKLKIQMEREEKAARSVVNSGFSSVRIIFF